MNEMMLQMLIKALGIKPEDIKALISSFSVAEDIKVLLADNLEVNKQILEALKKRGGK
jgi:hypothetical protein